MTLWKEQNLFGEDYTTSYNFEAPFIFGINFITSLKISSVFVDLMFNYNYSPEIDFDFQNNYGNKTLSEIKSYSFAIYAGNNFTNSLSAKIGLLKTSADVFNYSKNGSLLQIAFENKSSNNQKFGLVFEYGLDSDFYDSDVINIALTGKMEFVF